MSKIVKMRMNDYQERTIIFTFAENHEWDYEDGDLTAFLCEYYEDYEEYREWYLMMVA